MLEVRDLHAEVDGKPVLRGVSIKVAPGELALVVGPNGSGKSSLLRTVAGDPRYHVTSGDVLLNGESILGISPDERAKKGLFLAFQAPPEFEGVTLATVLLRAAGRERDPRAFSELAALAAKVGLDPSYLSRPLNKGFSGGERKRSELLQALFLGRDYLLLDEIDSGVDLEGLRRVAGIIDELVSAGKAVLLVSHNPALLDLIRPDSVYVLKDGALARSGGPEILEDVLRSGLYD